jgi:hypothetical protein
MFCVKCGRENREDASLCVQCGANLVQASGLPIAERPSRPGRAPWMVGVIAVIVVAAIVTSTAVYAWNLYQSHESGDVVVDGKTLVGADGEPIELFQNSAASNVTWAQLRQFLLTDQTDRIPYNDSTFVCADYAERLHNNAEKAGIRAGYVVIDFASGTPSHAINVFTTTDRGSIYVDDTGTTEPSPCSADKTVDVQVGRSYIPESVFPCPGYSVTWENMGKVAKVSVIW